MSSREAARRRSGRPPRASPRAAVVAEAAEDQLGRARARAVPVAIVATMIRTPSSRHVAPVAQRDVADVADAEAVDERDAGLHLVDDRGRRPDELDDGAVLGDHDRVRRDAGVAARAARGRPASGTRRGPASPPSAGRARAASAAPRRSRDPETWTSAFSSCSTSAPRRVSWLIESWTRSSFPGTGRAEMITVSPRSTGPPDGRRTRCASAPTSARPGCRCRGSAARSGGISSRSPG